MKNTLLIIALSIIFLSACSMFSDKTVQKAPQPPYASQPASTEAQLSSRDSSQSPATIKKIQTILRQQGFYFGKIDGQWGPGTESALHNYQANHSLAITGKLDAETMTSLDLNNQ